MQDGVWPGRGLSGSLDGQHGVACRVAVLGVMMRGILGIVVRVGRKQRAYWQLTGMSQQGK
jgi:hypothetical protein